MVAVVDSMVFAAAFAASVWVFAATLVPALPRIIALLRGEADIAAMPERFAVVSDRRLRTRVSSVQVSHPVSFRAAA
ncbi:hypothetical protein BH10PSE15_BH10PSE15_16040 [soil metagenome]